MYYGKKIGVVVPAHNEEKHVGSVIELMPDYVDRIYVVNDASTDRTPEIAAAQAVKNGKLVLINRPYKGGVGAAILSGHSVALKESMDVIAVMAGDGQMDPVHLGRIIQPVIDGEADYAKGDRLSSRVDRHEMPLFRLFGNILLTSLTRMASGYWSIVDPQNGYTAISAKTLLKLDLDRIERGFAFENDMLVKLNVVGATVIDVPHPALYRGQDSKIRYSDFIIRTTLVLLKDTVWRLWSKYLRGKRFKKRSAPQAIKQR